MTGEQSRVRPATLAVFCVTASSAWAQEAPVTLIHRPKLGSPVDSTPRAVGTGPPRHNSPAWLPFKARAGQVVRLSIRHCSRPGTTTPDTAAFASTVAGSLGGHCNGHYE
jgi:hypothetical protein